jgi:sporulation protein YlmC with PRC-barrel domain
MIAAAFGVATLTVTAAQAQSTKPKVAETAPAPISGEQARVNLQEWGYDELYKSGWRAEDLIGADVQGKAGNAIGNVENIMIGPDGKALSIIAEIGGFLDIGDTHINVPWDQVQLTSGQTSVKVPLAEDNIDQFSLFGTQGRFNRQEAASMQQVSDATTGPRVWRATELIGDYVNLKSGAGYGYVDDLIFDRNGTLKAVVVTRDVGSGPAGPFAYPFYGYDYGGFNPGFDNYTLPYEENEVGAVEPYDYESMEGGIFE